MELIDILEVFRDHMVELSILIFEFIGVGIIIVSGIHGFYLYLKKSFSQACEASGATCTALRRQS